MTLFIILGRELFMTDHSLNDSDIKFLANTGDVAITVDESLFEVTIAFHVQYTILYMYNARVFYLKENASASGQISYSRFFLELFLKPRNEFLAWKTILSF